MGRPPAGGTRCHVAGLSLRQRSIKRNPPGTPPCRCRLISRTPYPIQLVNLHYSAHMEALSRDRFARGPGRPRRGTGRPVSFREGPGPTRFYQQRARYPQKRTIPCKSITTPGVHPLHRPLLPAHSICACYCKTIPGESGTRSVAVNVVLRMPRSRLRLAPGMLSEPFYGHASP